MMIKTKLFDPNFEKDNCGFGLIAQKDGIRSRSIVNNAIDLRYYVIIKNL